LTGIGKVSQEEEKRSADIPPPGRGDTTPAATSRKTFPATAAKEATRVYFFAGSNIGLTDSIGYHRIDLVCERKDEP
jgi:hypothetical protein